MNQATRSRGLRTGILLASALICVALPCSGQVHQTTHRDGIETGFYEMKFKTEDSDKEATAVFFLRRDGDKVELYDLATKKKMESRISESAIWGATKSGTIKSAGFKLNSKNKELPSYLVVATASGEGLYAAGFSKNQQFDVAISNLPSVWACGNHNNPTHTA